METFSNQGGNVLLGYSPHQSQRSLEIPTSSSSSSDPEIDFNDVFGGPPRRFSIQEMRTRYSFSEQINSGSFRGMEERLSLSGPRDKAVFGEEIGIRGQCPNDDFFDDIFKGDQSYSSPRRSVWDTDSYGSNPGSRVMSPARPLPPKAEPFGTSLPAQFSLAAKLTKAMEFQGFGSGNRSPYKFKDSVSNYSTSLSRFSNQAVQGLDELKSDDRLPHDQSSLCDQFSLNTEEPSGLAKSDEAEKGNRLKNDEKSAGPPSNISQFHFSIYKWAGKGIPLQMPLRGRNGSKSKEWGKLERCLSSNGRIESDSIVSELLTVNIPDVNTLLQSDSISTETKSSIANVDKKRDLTTEYGEQPCQVFEQAVLDVPESKSHNSVHRTTVNVSGTIFVSNKNIEMENGISEAKKEVQKADLQSPHSVFNDKLEEQGNDNTTRKGEEKESTNLADVNVNFSKNVAKHDGIKKNSVSADVKVQSKNSGDTFGRSRVKGKVHEYVKIFDQEADSKPQRNMHTQNKSSRWKTTKVHEATDEARTSTKPIDKKMFQPNVHKMSDSSFMVHENREQSGKQYSPTRTTISKPSNYSAGQEGASFSESISDGPKDTFENIDDLFQRGFLIEELSHEEEKSLRSDQDGDVFKVSDDKIRQWSNGKKGNIRSLLSTLQYVLWPDSGWKPVPLVDIIEGSQVKRAYQKALLCLHPDKLQQKCAASHQKYIAEKVFDILKEAWDHFSTPGPL